MKLILETQELEAIVKENIAAKYPDNNISVSIQNKRNGIEVTVVLTEKLAEKEADCLVYDDKDCVEAEDCVEETGCCRTADELEEETLA